MSLRRILLTGFEPFGGESVNPSWQVAERFEDSLIGDLEIRVVRLPVDCKRAARELKSAISRIRPTAIIGLGQAGGRTALSIEKVAINFADERADRESGERAQGKPIVRGAPDAYFARLPIAALIGAITARGIPAAMSLSAGAYVCNTVMYTALHTLRARPEVPIGFIHLPYEAGQATQHPSRATMGIDLMALGIEAALELIAARLNHPKARRDRQPHRPPPSRP
jgi:pyroglutamyl-peptidase